MAHKKDGEVSPIVAIVIPRYGKMISEQKVCRCVARFGKISPLSSGRTLLR